MTDYFNSIRKAVLCAVLLALLSSESATAQFIDLSLDIDSELTAATERALDFGTLIKNSGRESINFGSPNMGIFSIRALENQMVMVTLQKPTVLRHDDPTIKDTVPLELFSRYGYSINNFQDSHPMPGATSMIKVAPNPDPGPWNSIYIFIYGSVNIGNIPDGVYSNEIVLDVEYL